MPRKSVPPDKPEANSDNAHEQDDSLLPMTDNIGVVPLSEDNSQNASDEEVDNSSTSEEDKVVSPTVTRSGRSIRKPKALSEFVTYKIDHKLDTVANEKKVTQLKRINITPLGVSAIFNSSTIIETSTLQTTNSNTMAALQVLEDGELVDEVLQSGTGEISKKFPIYQSDYLGQY